MASICLYFQVHQPYRVKNLKVFDIGNFSDYFADSSQSDLNNAKVLNKVAQKSYLPANNLLFELLKEHEEFKISFSFSGTVLEQFETMSPAVVDSFKRLVDTGKVEVLSETYYHSLAFFKSLAEFESQVNLHKQKIKEVFDAEPQVFRNTELAYNNELAKWADEKGYKAILAEGWDGILGWKSPNFVYKPVNTKNIKLLLKNYRLSDDIAFRFSEKNWREWPLTAEKFTNWVNSVNGNGEVINLFMDYETFGEHQWEDSGIFDFLYNLPKEILKHPDNNFLTPSEVADTYPSRGEIDCPHTLTWADTDRDLTAWLGNKLQWEAFERIYKLEKKIKSTNDALLIDKWRKLQTSDHFYYMCTKWFNDGDVHAYFSPYESPYDAFINYMNAVTDLELNLHS